MITATTSTRVHFNDLHHDHREWLNALQFHKQDLAIQEHRLQDIVQRNTGVQVMAGVEHFQNRFIREHEVIDELRHDIKQAENALEKEMKEHPVAIGRRFFSDHDDLRDRYRTFEKLQHELKQEFRLWLAKHM